MFSPVIRTRCGALLLAAVLTALAPRAAAQKTSLDGEWHFLADPDGKLKVTDLATAPKARTARVPGSWQSEFADLRDYAGVAWYWRTFKVELPAPGHAVLIRFGAVDYRAEVYVNGQKAGEHEGGYLPFEIDVTPWLRAEENELAVRVADPGAQPAEVEGIRYAEIPHGKQNWYVQTSGLWQSVELQISPRTRISALHVRAAADGRFAISLDILGAAEGGAAPGDRFAGAAIRDADGKVVWLQTELLAPGQMRCALAGTLYSPHLWSPNTPYLYMVEAWLNSGATASSRFGFRTFETRGGRFYLNGRLIYLRGALDQDFYPDTVYTPPSLGFLREEMSEAKSLGLNLLRCHLKVPDPRYLDSADAAGLLVWYEIPNWDKLTPDAERRALETLRGMAERDWNHPSLVAVSLLNESWGANLKEAADRAWLKEFAGQAHALVPGWLVDDNSACCDNFHVTTDIADFHDYAAIPNAAGDFDRFVSDLAGRPSWLWSPYGDARRGNDEPLMVSEFGNWGLPHPPEPRPWWFNRDFQGLEITRPAGFAERFAAYGYASLFPSLEALADASEEREYESLQYEIESLRAHPEIQGYVITEFTDVNWESNGLLDLWRRPKSFARSLAGLESDDLILPRIAKHNFVSGERVHADLLFSHYSERTLSGATVRWQLDGFAQTYVSALPPAETGSVIKAGAIDFKAPPVAAPTRRRLTFRVEAAGQTITENSLDLFFFPPPSQSLRPAVAFEDPSGRLRRLAEEMRSRGYLAPSGEEALPVLIASALDANARAILEKGGRVILIATEHQTLAPGLEVVPRAGSNLDGNWISGFLWVRKDQPPFREIDFRSVNDQPGVGTALPGFEAEAATAPAVVRGIPAGAFQDVLAGMFYGWLQSNVGVLVQARAGRGKLLICTFGLATSYGSDPYATALLDALVDYAVSGFQPKFEIP